MIDEIRNSFPGVSCAALDAAGNVTTACYGVSDQEKNIPVDEQTIFPACSMSKFVTALCLMKLHEQAVIDIDKPVNQYLQQWKLLRADGTESDATVRAIMCHTAGIIDGENGFYGLRRNDPEISLMDILEGRTFYNSRPVRAQKPQGTSFEYSDAGYCVLQLLIEEVTHKAFEAAAQEIIFDQLHLRCTFYASPEHLAHYENSKAMATGYDGDGLPLPGRFPPCPDLAGAGLWSTPKELLTIAHAFISAYNGKSSFLQEKTAKVMAAPVDKFPCTGLGVFVLGEELLMTQGWGEHGQCMMKMDCRTKQISVVMTNRNPEKEQSQSGVEWLVDQKLIAI